MTLHHDQHVSHNRYEMIHNALVRSPYIAGRNIRVELHDEHAVLKGVVQTYYQKQLAQESIRGLAGIKQIRNEIEVSAQPCG